MTTPEPTSAVPETPEAGPALRGGVRPSGSPLVGAVAVAMIMVSALTIITYTLVPVPGQRSFGGWNYVVAGVLFGLSLVLGPVEEARVSRRVS